MTLSRSLQEFALDHQFPWTICSTIAAAFAETGQFSIAEEWQRMALENAPSEWKEAQEYSLDLYISGKPFRETEPPTIVH